MSRAALFAICSMLGVLTSRVAHATPNFPAAIQSELALGYVPECTLCHLTLLGGVGTAKTAFAKSMQTRGLLPFDIDTLKMALSLMTSERVVSADGCLPDIEELKVRRNPNATNDAKPCPSVPDPGVGGSGSAGAPSTAGSPSTTAGAANEPAQPTAGTATQPASPHDAPPVAEFGCRGATIARHGTESEGEALFAAGVVVACLLRLRRRQLGPG